MLYTKKTFDTEHEVEEADAALVGIPWDSTETGKSVKHGPLFIREALKNTPGYDPGSGRNPLGKLKFCDLGDLEVVPGNWSLTKERIADTIREMFARNEKIFPIFLGGDHLITLGILESLPYDKITVIDFDAHADLLPDWLGEKYSHITWAHHVKNSPKFDLVQVGVRSWYEREDVKSVKKTIEKTENPLVYVTVDMDVFDPAYAPEVGTPEAGGLSPGEFLSLLAEACRNRVIGLDVVECASDRVNTPTAVLAAYIIKKTLSEVFGKRI
jgi:agmatinase